MRAWIRFGENVVLLALCACLPLPALSQSVEPNVVFILVDDLRWDALGSSGHPFIETPNIDRIANEGINFTNAFVTTPICSPGRASFYTGQYTRTHDIKGNGGYNSVSDRTLRNWARALQEVGYRTAHIGKWHMDPTSAPRNGFDYWVGFKGQGSHNGVFLNVNGIPVNETGYTTDVLTDYAIDFVQQDHGGRPFAMTLAFKAVHAPWPSDNSNVPPDLRTLYENETIPRAPSAQSGYTLEGKPMLVNPPEGMNPPVPGSTGVADAIVRNQLRMTVHIDQNIGRLFSALDTAGKLDDTLFIFTSDNGYFWSEHGLGDKRAAYDEAIRIPLLMRLPGLIMPGISSNALVANIDIAPTLMSLGGADVPSHVQGESLLPLMYDPSAEVRGSFLAEYFQESAYPRIATWKAIRTQQFKYITHPDFGASYDELYDLTTDPYEMNNIVNESYAQTTLADMKNQLGQLEQQIQFDTKQLVVSGDTLDYAITEDSTVAGTGSTIRIGSNANAPAGGRNAVFVFELPVLEPGDSIDSASLTYRVRPLNSNNPATHADIWMLGIGDSTRRMNYLESESDGNRDHQLIDDNMLWWDRSQSFVATTPDAAAALAASLNAFYREHPDYPGGSYLYLRLNPDADTGNGDAGWDVFSADETESRFRPSLTLTFSSLAIIGELTVDHEWKELCTNGSAQDAVVLLGPPTYNGEHPGVMRMRPTENADCPYQVRLQEWDYRGRDFNDWWHTSEQVSYLHLSPRVYEMDDGSIWEVGSFQHSGTGNWKWVGFQRVYSDPPLVFLTLQSTNGEQAATVRAKEVGRYGFQAAIFEEEYLMDGHLQEDIGYVAIYHPDASSSDRVDGHATFNGMDYAYTLHRTWADHSWATVDGVQLKLEEEQSLDQEVGHMEEAIDVLQIADQVFAQQVSSWGNDTTALRRR